jgi:hypothetical protein
MLRDGLSLGSLCAQRLRYDSLTELGSLCMNGMGFRDFLDLRKKIFFLKPEYPKAI